MVFVLIGLHPFMVSMIKKGGEVERSFCGSSLVAAMTVVTAAHCVTGLSPNEFKVNDCKVIEFKVNEFKVNEFNVNEFKVNEFKVNDFKVNEFKVNEFKVNEFNPNESKVTDC
jgi:secreted trypsin-like serine protease